MAPLTVEETVRLRRCLDQNTVALTNLAKALQGLTREAHKVTQVFLAAKARDLLRQGETNAGSDATDEIGEVDSVEG